MIRKASVVLIVFFTTIMIQAQSNQVLVNQWALGTNEEIGCVASFRPELFAGWQWNQYVSWAKCSKNPSPGSSTGGAAFKNGTKNGNGVIGEEALLWQDFNLQARGVTQASSYDFTISAWGIGIRTIYNKFRLYGSDDGQNWILLDDEFLLMPDQSPTKWMFYQGSTKAFNHYDWYRLEWASLYNSETPGAKMTGVSLLVSPVGPTPTPTAIPTATNTPMPTATPETFQLFPASGIKVVCNGSLRVLSPAGNSVEIRCD